jgi:ParB-like chromosome segregation protein Spo0J
MVIDGKERLRAARAAGIESEVKYHDVAFSDDLERLRFAIRANWLRRAAMREDREAQERHLRGLHLTTRELSRMLGTARAGDARGASVPTASRNGVVKKGKRPSFKPSSSRIWGTLERWMAGCRDAEELAGQGMTHKDIGIWLQQRYDLEEPVEALTVWSLIRNATVWRAAGYEFPPYGEVPSKPWE